MEMLLGAAYGWGLLQIACRLAYHYRQTHAEWWEEACPEPPEAPVWVQAVSLAGGAAAGAWSGSAAEAALVFLWLGALLTAAVADAYWFVLPRRYSAIIALLGAVRAGSLGIWWEVLPAAAIMGLLAWGLYGLARGGMGAGDVWFVAALAMWTGLDGALSACWLATLAALAYWLVCRRRGRFVRAIPFGPFLAAGFYCMYWYG